MSEPYIPQSKLLAQLLASQRHGPVLSAGQGIANVVEDLARAYGMKALNDQDKATAKTNAGDSAKLLSMVLQGARPLATSGEDMMNGVTPIPAQTAFPGGTSSMADRLSAVMGGQAVPPQQQAQQADNPVFGAPAAINAIQRTAAVNPEVANQMAPIAMQLAEQMKPRAPRALPGMKPGDQLPTQNADGTISFQTAPGTIDAKPLTNIAQANDDLKNGRISQAERDAIVKKETQIAAAPQVATEFAYDRTLKINRPVTNAEKTAEPTRYDRPIASPQTEAYDKNGNKVGTFDVNDPALKAKLDAGDWTTQAPKQQTDQEKRSMGFANRMQNAEQDLTKLYGGVPADGDKPAVKGVNPAEGVGGALQNTRIPFIQGPDSSIVPNSMRSNAFQEEKRAKMEWMTAMLRKDSGATIRDEEYDAIDKQYFPQNGDGVKVLADKAKARENAMAGIMREATPGNQSAPSAPSKNVDPAVWAHMTPEERALFK